MIFSYLHNTKPRRPKVRYKHINRKLGDNYGLKVIFFVLLKILFKVMQKLFNVEQKTVVHSCFCFKLGEINAWQIDSWSDREFFYLAQILFAFVQIHAETQTNCIVKREKYTLSHLFCFDVKTFGGIVLISELVFFFLN